MSRKVYIVDDDAALRKALALLFRSVEIDAETFPSAQAFLEAYRPAPPGDHCCLVTDVRMPGMSGLELQAELERRQFDIAVIVLSGHGDVPLAVRAMSAGALSFLEKPINEQDLLDLVFKAFNGTSPLPAQAQHDALEAHRTLLTPRQRDIFDLSMKGLQTKEVANRLNLSPRTVEVHRANILQRLQAPTFTKLISDFLQRNGAN